MNRSYEYINRFLYFVIRPAPGRDGRALLYCSGVNLDRFLPITKGRHRPMSNPVMRGLQLVNLDVRALALSDGARPVAITGNDCAGIVPVEEGWYKDLLLIENASESLPEKIINYCPLGILKKTFNAILLQEKAPDELPSPEELQAYIEGLCRKYGM